MKFKNIQPETVKKFRILKNKEARKVPISQRLYDLLLKYLEGKEYVFVLSISRINMTLDPMMPPDVAIQKQERNLCYHSWRHFYNTYLFSENVSAEKVNAVIGHSSGG
jgi:integrase